MSYTLTRDISYTSERGYRNCYDLYMPDGDEKIPLVIYFYGGSLKSGHKDNNKFAPALADCGVAVAVPDYRLYPEAKYPDFINDAADAVAKILSSLPDRIDRVYIGGHSAGAYLSLMMSFDHSYLDIRRVDRSRLAGWLFISGSTAKHKTILEYEGLDPRIVRVDETSALYYADISVGEPIFIATSDMDLPARREQNYLFRATLESFAYPARIDFVDLAGCKHAEFVKPGSDGAVPILPYVMKFIKETRNA